MNDNQNSPSDSNAEGTSFRNKNIALGLFLPQLDRYLSDPDELPLDDSADSVRVRIDQAIKSIENRSEELEEYAQSKVTLWRITTASCAIIGALALLAGIGYPKFRLAGTLVAGIEIVALFYSSKKMKEAAVDTLILRDLKNRYRPQLDQAESLSQMRNLQNLIREEMDQLSVDPRPQEG